MNYICDYQRYYLNFLNVKIKRLPTYLPPFRFLSSLHDSSLLVCGCSWTMITSSRLYKKQSTLSIQSDSQVNKLFLVMLLSCVVYSCRLDAIV